MTSDEEERNTFYVTIVLTFIESANRRKRTEQGRKLKSLLILRPIVTYW